MAQEALAEGKCVVVGLQSTGEATQDAALEAMEVRRPGPTHAWLHMPNGDAQPPRPSCDLNRTGAAP